MRANDHVEPEPITREEPETKNVQVFDIRQLAKDFIILGIKGKLLRVRRKCDGAEFWLRVAILE